jgi:hypothetical protein
MTGASIKEVEATLTRSQNLVDQGIVSGVRDAQITALYLAASEVIAAADLERVVCLVRESLNTTAVGPREDLVRRLAVLVLVDLAGRRNGNATRKA